MWGEECVKNFDKCKRLTASSSQSHVPSMSLYANNVIDTLDSMSL